MPFRNDSIIIKKRLINNGLFLTRLPIRLIPTNNFVKIVHIGRKMNENKEVAIGK